MVQLEASVLLDSNIDDGEPTTTRGTVIRMYTVLRVERYDGVPDCARVLSRHRSLEEAELVKRRVQSLVERSHLSGETGMKRDDIRILCTAGKLVPGREIAARQLKQLTVATAARRPA